MVPGEIHRKALWEVQGGRVHVAEGGGEVGVGAVGAEVQHHLAGARHLRMSEGRGKRRKGCVEGGESKRGNYGSNYP